MRAFYRRVLLVLIALLAADALVACVCVCQSHASDKLLASGRWRPVVLSDAPQGGTSTVHMLDSDRRTLRFDFKVSNTLDYPWAGAGLLMEDGQGRPMQVDLSRYNRITFVARCAPANALIFDLSIFDEAVSKADNLLTYPTPTTFFSCNERGVPVSLDLTRLIIPQWWFILLKRNLSQQSYKLNHVARLEFAASSQSPHEVASTVEISGLTLHGRDHRYLVALALILLASWVAFGAWFFRAHSRALMACLDTGGKKDLPVVAYRQLTLEPHRDKEKACILRFMATNYANPALDLEGVVAGTTVNRNKINEVLKFELGLTFTSYLNKLRLTEAAKLLKENTGLAVAEIAYSVGYSNVSYFNRLFKEEYGCTPKTFRSAATLEQAAE